MSAREASPLQELSNNTASWWFRDPGLRSHALAIFVCCVSYFNLGYDGPLISGLLANKNFLAHLGFTKPNDIGLMTSATPLGGLPSVFLVPYIADRFGRRITLAIGAVFIITGAIMQTFLSGGWGMFGGRFVMGFGSVFCTVISGTFVAEIAHPRLRPQATAINISCFNVGSILAAWTTCGTLRIAGHWSWRTATILQAAPSIIVLVLLPFIEDSPRYLVSRGKTHEAHRVLAKYHANGDKDDELVKFEMEQIVRTVQIAETHKTQGSFASFFKTKGNRHRLFIVTLIGIANQWSGYGIIFFYLPFILRSVGMVSSTDQTAFNGGLQIWNWVVSMIMSLLTKRVGRRPMALTGLTGMLISYSVITACSARYSIDRNVVAGQTVLAFLYIYFGFFVCCFTPMSAVYITEIMSYELRARGMAINFFTTLAAASFNSWVNPIAFAAIAWRYYLVFIGVNAIALVSVYLFFPETKGRLLEDVASIFDVKRPGEHVEGQNNHVPRLDRDGAGQELERDLYKEK